MSLAAQFPTQHSGACGPSYSCCWSWEGLQSGPCLFLELCHPSPFLPDPQIPGSLTSSGTCHPSVHQDPSLPGFAGSVPSAQTVLPILAYPNA